MSCDCYGRVKENLSKHFQDKAPAGSANFEIEVEGYVFGISDEGVTHRAATNVKVRYQAPKKAGGVKKVTQSTFVRATFCPFCGLNYQSGQPAKLDTPPQAE